VEDNSHAGKGPVVLDIGGDIGALIVTMPAALAGEEVEACPIAGAAFDTYSAHPGSHLPHVAVLARPDGSSMRHLAVFAELQDGEYQLYLRPNGDARLTAVVRGAQVTSAVWPAAG
jgi:hypothetical protein